MGGGGGGGGGGASRGEGGEGKQREGGEREREIRLETAREKDKVHLWVCSLGHLDGLAGDPGTGQAFVSGTMA